jgi:hypothetical protein
MNDLPTTDVRTNAYTACVTPETIPCVASVMQKLLPNESYDPDFKGQAIETYYFDTVNFDLRAARIKKDKYCTVRIRYYRANGTYALSAKTESGKFRKEIPEQQAKWYLQNALDWNAFPADIQARLLELIGSFELVPVVCVEFTRYAVEDDTNRLTLDIGTKTNTGKVFPSVAILENKTTADPPEPMEAIKALGLPPIKLSKFLWSTTYGVR